MTQNCINKPIMETDISVCLWVIIRTYSFFFPVSTSLFL